MKKIEAFTQIVFITDFGGFVTVCLVQWAHVCFVTMTEFNIFEQSLSKNAKATRQKQAKHTNVKSCHNAHWILSILY